MEPLKNGLGVERGVSPNLHNNMRNAWLNFSVTCDLCSVFSNCVYLEQKKR